MGFKIAIFSLNQWALDFTGNTKRIIKSIDLAFGKDAIYRAGPELEICGYSIEDAFYEQDTVYHSWASLLKIIEHSAKMDMIIDVGMPVFNSALYNCRVIIYKSRILCIRAKTSLATEGNYRESRYFTPWNIKAGVVAYKLPLFVSQQLGQTYAPFGANFILELDQPNGCDTFKIGWEICQELWDTKNVSSDLYRDFGCHLIVNSSASYWELRKLNTVLDMVRGVSLRAGACYAFSNCVGCDGQRYVFYGRSCIFNKGKLVAITPWEDEGLFKEIQMITYTIFPREIDENRACMSIKTSNSFGIGKVWDLLDPPTDVSQIDSSYNRFYLKVCLKESKTHQIIDNKPILDPTLAFEGEIDLYVSLWLWDYLRKSQMAGFMMPLSGGLDSSSVATLVYSMCNYLYSSLNKGDLEIQEYFNKIHKIKKNELISTLKSPEDICKRLLKCCYLSTKYSSQATQKRARVLSGSIGAEFVDLSVQDIYSKFRSLLGANSSSAVTLLDQNLQARLRMVATYYLSEGNRIVLATGNVDEAIMGYLTKYDCSSADLNPIGGLCKDDLRSYMTFCCEFLYSDKYDFKEIVYEIVEAPPSAELTGAEQSDEYEIGLTYDEISVFGKIRRGIYACSGPRGAFETIWENRHREPFCSKIRCLAELNDDGLNGNAAFELGQLVKRFYTRYARNRHKLTVLTPALHAETYSPDDNRFDHRHFLYAPWTEQFRCIDEMIDKIKNPIPEIYRTPRT